MEEYYFKDQAREQIEMFLKVCSMNLESLKTISKLLPDAIKTMELVVNDHLPKLLDLPENFESEQDVDQELMILTDLVHGLLWRIHKLSRF